MDSRAGANAAIRWMMLVLLTACRLSAAVIEGPSAESPYRQPQVAVAGDRVDVTFGSGNALYFSQSTDAGRTYSAPVRVADSGVLSLGMHRGPRIVLTPDAIVISAVYGDQGKGADGDLLAFRSTDAGRTWSKGVRVNDRPGAAREGLHAMTADGNFLYSVWLDDRAGGKELYGASSKDGGTTWSPNRLIYHSPDGHICECCHPSVAVRGGGKEIYAMFRNSLGGSRDFYLAATHDGGVTFHVSKVGEGTWHLNACPMDGGALTLDAKGPVTVWRRESTVYLDRAGEPESEIGAGKNPAMAGGKVLWSAPDGLREWKSGASSRLLDPNGAYPAVAAGGGHAAAAWESKGRIVIEPLN